MKGFRWLINTAIVLLAAALTAGPAYAQSDIARSVRDRAMAAVSKIQGPCDHDIKNYCSSITPDNGRLLLCMEAHDDKLSPQCLIELHEAATIVHAAVDLVKQATLMCRDDITKFCKGIQPGQGRLAQCLSANGTHISKTCSDAMENLRAAAK